MNPRIVSILFLSCFLTLVEGRKHSNVLRGKLERSFRRALKSDKEDELMLMPEEASEEAGEIEIATDQCRDMPVRVRTDESQVNFATLYSGIYAWGDTSDLKDKKLCDSFMAAYTYLTDCSDIPGSYREVAKCTVVKDAVGPIEDAFLLKLTYFANVVNGAMLYHFDDPEPSCFCDRCPGLESFPGIYTADDNGPVCTCYCDIFSDNLSNTACTCRSPKIADLIEVLNVAYKDDNFYFLDARQLAIDETCENTGETTTFDDTYICPGQEDKEFENLFTDFPSAFPTESPSITPSGTPS